MPELRLQAMGTSMLLRVETDDVVGADAALLRAAAAIEAIERTCSRFDPTSELSRLNALGEARVSPLLADVVELALAGRERTGGLFDPTVHDAVVAAGYDRSFEQLTDDADEPPTAEPRPRLGSTAMCGGDAAVHGERVVLGRGVRLDLGGIAKGYAADAACAVLGALGPCLVDAGGDVAVRGTWPIAVDGGPVLELTDAAVATSGRDRRTWHRDGARRHHLIDPGTGAPATDGPLRATVVAPTAAEAEVLAKAAFLGAAPCAPTVLVHEDGSTTLTGGLA